MRNIWTKLSGDTDPTKYTMKKIPVCICGNVLMIRVFPKIIGVCHKCGKKFKVEDFKFDSDNIEDSMKDDLHGWIK